MLPPSITVPGAFGYAAAAVQTADEIASSVAASRAADVAVQLPPPVVMASSAAPRWVVSTAWKRALCPARAAALPG